ncbi:AMP-binding protein [Synergistes jonesii]|uniref:AMP-binding protein n=1 Tax=Synergistes jonesii TaxID=2754 RepID=UPI00242E6554|nr:AMP-binding protein [Synergistes jonesii]
MIRLASRLDIIVRDNLNRLPSEPFIWWQKTWWSRGAFLELIEECEKRLAASNFKRGQRVALLMPNSPVLLATAVAVWRLGGAVALIDFRSGYAPLIKQLCHADVFAALTYRGLEDIVPLISEEGIPCSVMNLDTLDENIPGRPCAQEDEETAVIFYTSGTTGEPKAVPLTHDNLMACIDGCVEHIDMLNEDDVFLNALPNSNVFGFLCGALLPLVKATRQAVLASFMPVAAAMDAIKSAEVSIIPAVPAMVGMMASAVSHGTSLSSSLRCVLSGGDRLPPEISRRAGKILGVPVLQGYGLTEASSVVALPPSMSSAREGSVGTLLSCVEAKICGDGGEELPCGSEGTLWLRGASVASRYYHNEALTAERFADGWFNTCDIAKFDGEGYLYLVGRSSDVIFVGGFKVYAREVENVLEEHPSVKDAAVVGVPRSISGEIVKAYILPEGGEKPSPKALIDYCKKRLAYYKVPRIIEFVSEMPRSTAGEIVKRKLLKD